MFAPTRTKLCNFLFFVIIYIYIFIFIIYILDIQKYFGGRGRYDSYDSYDYLRRDVNEENRLRMKKNNERKLQKELEKK